MHDDVHPLQFSSGQPSTTSLIQEAGNVLNDTVHDQIRKLKEHAYDLSTFTLNDLHDAVYYQSFL